MIRPWPITTPTITRFRSLAQDVKLARLGVDKLQRGVDRQVVQAVEMARLTVKRLEDQLADTQLVAPFDGQVTSVGIAAGDAVEAFKPVMVVADLSAWK